MKELSGKMKVAKRASNNINKGQLIGKYKKPMTLMQRNKMYPVTLSVHILYGKSELSAHQARNEIEKEWIKFGSFISHGSSVDTMDPESVTHTQVGFKEKDIVKARTIAKTIMKKYKVKGTFIEFKN